MALRKLGAFALGNLGLQASPLVAANFPLPMRRLSTDGLWDNCYLSEIVSLLPKGPGDAQSAADAIAAAARRHAGDNEFASPYTREALSQGLDLPWWDKLLGMTFKGGKVHLKQLTGGKMDDITVLLAYVEVVDAPPPPGPTAVQQEHVPGDGAADSDAPASGEQAH
ncbi:hypothetical protein HYH03_015164 [Edaphochlamys debaryana]|uniref:Protein phosphatase n=1 Tax=Edaphochlamys debaryana TaxID=47281 RepID=A0A835XMS9_9CHLO|nr:hypothetical protein HYH03_015164 [Edaphochlamys debaryana]|eukprot:KAG2486202.1 hypothetical protein HYH03_015164 [Edaphochlamys debaryana]